MRWHPPTIAYVERRTTEGLTKKDIIRCLKRFVAREIYALLPHQRPQPRRPGISHQPLDIYRGFNAAAESFFGTLKRELAERRRWPTRADARRDLIRWVEGWFNTRRLHSSIDYHAPIEWENNYHHRDGDGIAA